MKRSPKKTLLFALAGTAALAFATVAQATTVTNIDLTDYYTAGQNWSTATNGTVLADAVEGGAGNTGTGLHFVNTTAQFVRVNPGDTVTISGLDVALTSNTVINMLVNNFYGDGFGSQEAELTFTNSDNATQTFYFYGGQTVRDYLNNVYQNTLDGKPGSGVTAQPWFISTSGDDVRLDAQSMMLSGWGGTSLTSFSMFASGSAAVDVLTALQVEVDTGAPVVNAPEPGSLAMLVFGLLAVLGFAAAGRKRRLS